MHFKASAGKIIKIQNNYWL